MRFKKCAVRGCPNRAGHYGLCRLHHRRAWRLMRKNPEEFGRLNYRHPAITRAVRFSLRDSAGETCGNRLAQQQTQRRAPL